MRKSTKQPAAPVTETDLDAPLRAYLLREGYTVRSEVQHCDLTATRDDELIVIELKRGLSLALLAQAVRRQQITDSVYVAIPRPANKRKWMAQTHDTQVLLRRLELGLILVALPPQRPPVEIVFHPLPGERRKRPAARRAVLREMAQRSDDYNCAGSTRRKLVTAYRENAICIACCLAELGPLSPRRLRALQTGPKTLSILSRNVYGWFERIARGEYGITAKGREALGEYPELAQEYRKRARGEAAAVE